MSASATEATSIQTSKCEPGIGCIVRPPDSADRIPLEIPRLKQGLPAASSRDTIKAFHFYRPQTDFPGALKSWQILVPPGVGRIQGDRAKCGYLDRHLPDLPSSAPGPHACNDPSIAYNWELPQK